ncbi:hypothetical protein ACR42A_30625 [Burkholderia gladioli]|uniref:hypothetical protein n=1 Tax=Burkholderia gladioli TaxID=28095 RepID=UPI003DA45BEE
MKTLPLAAACACALLFSACQSGPVARPSEQTISSADMYQALIRVKQEVGLFLYDSVQVKKQWPELRNRLDIATPTCGDGYVGFRIDSVTIEMSADSNLSLSGGAGLSIPATVKPNLSGTLSTTHSGSNKVTYAYFPPTNQDYEKQLNALGEAGANDPAIRDDAVLTPLLDNLRDSIIRATAVRPCFHATDDAYKGDSISVDVGISTESKAGGGISFYLVDLSASRDKKLNRATTLTIHFTPVDDRKPAPAEERKRPAAKAKSRG